MTILLPWGKRRLNHPQISEALRILNHEELYLNRPFFSVTLFICNYLFARSSMNHFRWQGKSFRVVLGRQSKKLTKFQTIWTLVRGTYRDTWVWFTDFRRCCPGSSETAFRNWLEIAQNYLKIEIIVPLKTQCLSDRT